MVASWRAVRSSAAAAASRRIDSAASNVAVPSAAAWNSAPTRRRGQYASGARSSTTSAVPRSRDPPASRRPTTTATSATEIVATSSRTAEDAKASLSVSFVARRYRSVTARIDADCAFARRYATRVGSPRITSTKWPDSCASERHCRSALSRVAIPTSTANTGTSGSVKITITALSRSWVAIATTVTAGSTAATTRAGR